MDGGGFIETAEWRGSIIEGYGFGVDCSTCLEKARDIVGGSNSRKIFCMLKVDGGNVDANLCWELEEAGRCCRHGVSSTGECRAATRTGYVEVWQFEFRYRQHGRAAARILLTEGVTVEARYT